MNLDLETKNEKESISTLRECPEDEKRQIYEGHTNKSIFLALC